MLRGSCSRGRKSCQQIRREGIRFSEAGLCGLRTAVLLAVVVKSVNVVDDVRKGGRLVSTTSPRFRWKSSAIITVVANLQLETREHGPLLLTSHLGCTIQGQLSTLKCREGELPLHTAMSNSRFTIRRRTISRRERSLAYFSLPLPRSCRPWHAFQTTSGIRALGILLPCADLSKPCRKCSCEFPVHHTCHIQNNMTWWTRCDSTSLRRC